MNRDELSVISGIIMVMSLLDFAVREIRRD